MIRPFCYECQQYSTPAYSTLPGTVQDVDVQYCTVLCAVAVGAREIDSTSFDPIMSGRHVTLGFTVLFHALIKIAGCNSLCWGLKLSPK